MVFTYREKQIAPLFDTVRQIHIIYAGFVRIVGGMQEILP
jgi:hypothetical protein